MDHRPSDQYTIESGSDAAARGGPRDSLLLTGMLTLEGRAQPVQVRVRNLSEGGLMAEYAGPAGNGEGVTIELRGVGAVAGTIAWATEGRIGIAFDRPIDPKVARKPVPVAPRALPKRNTLKPV